MKLPFLVKAVILVGIPLYAENMNFYHLGCYEQLLYERASYRLTLQWKVIMEEADIRHKANCAVFSINVIWGEISFLVTWNDRWDQKKRSQKMIGQFECNATDKDLVRKRYVSFSFMVSYISMTI